MKQQTPAQQLNGFLSRYSPEIRAIARSALTRLRKQVRPAFELVYDNYNALAIGLGPSERASEAVFSIALYPRWVSLFFLHGATLRDPDGLLKGNGRQVRHIVLERALVVDEPGPRSLIAQALKAASTPMVDIGRRRLVIKSASVKQRPRRPGKQKEVLLARGRVGSVIEHTRIIPAPPRDVYRAIADAKEHSAFTGATATGDAREGASFTAWDGYINGRTLRCDPGRLLVQEWSTTEWPADTAPSRLEWRFSRHPRGTRVTLRQTGVPRSQVASYRTGWIEFYWRPLRAYFAARR